VRQTNVSHFSMKRKGASRVKKVPNPLQLAARMLNAMENRLKSQSLTVAGGDPSQDPRAMHLDALADDGREESEAVTSTGGTYDFVLDSPQFEYGCVVCGECVSLSNAVVHTQHHLPKQVVVVCKGCATPSTNDVGEQG